ncbi:diacylglycerol/lipid kinase family protein [Streptococcus didelphis]|uniref:diacylglycerol/lipid kinase family protein n=1 Tax=Streptococcus didelphis TaxID=102886 RepID=UPI000477DA6A|nr:diacylglycerol kinase family protein [Streptococcus didelphis]
MIIDMVLHIIANPHAGNHQASKIVTKIKTYFEPQEVVVLYTKKEDDEENQVAKLLKVFKVGDQIMIVGGDGTLSKVLRHLPIELPVAYYPVGSANDFARALSLPNLEQTIAAIKSASFSSINCFTYDQGLILNSLDMGFPAYVVLRASQSKVKRILNKLHLGKLTYIVIAIKSLIISPKSSILIQREDGSQLFLNNLYLFSLANNTYFGGGITIWPTATALNDNIDIVYAEGQKFWKRIAILLAIVLKKHDISPLLKHESVKSLTLYFPEDSFVDIDGEMVYLKEITLSNQKRYFYM